MLPAPRDPVPPEAVPPDPPPLSTQLAGLLRGAGAQAARAVDGTRGVVLAEVGLGGGDDVPSLVQLARGAAAVGKAHGEWLEDLVVTLGRTVHVLRECSPTGVVLHARLDPVRGDVAAVRRGLAADDLQRAAQAATEVSTEFATEAGATETATEGAAGTGESAASAPARALVRFGPAPGPESSGSADRADAGPDLVRAGSGRRPGLPPVPAGGSVEGAGSAPHPVPNIPGRRLGLPSIPVVGPAERSGPAPDPGPGGSAVRLGLPPAPVRPDPAEPAEPAPGPRTGPAGPDRPTLSSLSTAPALRPASIPASMPASVPTTEPPPPAARPPSRPPEPPAVPARPPARLPAPAAAPQPASPPPRSPLPAPLPAPPLPLPRPARGRGAARDQEPALVAVDGAMPHTRTGALAVLALPPVAVLPRRRPSPPVPAPPLAHNPAAPAVLRQRWSSDLGTMRRLLDGLHRLS